MQSKAELTQEEAAKQLNVTRPAVARWESARVIPDISHLISISKLYNIALDELIRGNSKVERKIESDGKAKKWHLLVMIYFIAIVVYIVYLIVVHHIFMIGFLISTLLMLGIEIWIYFRKKP